jgi:acyl dehydratase
MSVDLVAIGRASPWIDVTWTSDDAMLYAVAVGAGHADPCRELAFTTENSRNVTQRVLPTFAAHLVQQAGGRPAVGNGSSTKRLYAGQSLTLSRPLPPNGRVRVCTRVTAIYEAPAGAIAVYESEAVDGVTGEAAFTCRNETILKDESRFGGSPAPARTWHAPDRAPDLEQRVATRVEQALIYRLCGDRNPIHSDPAFARECGFRQPILHGLCTYGIAGRVLLNAACDADPSRFQSMSVRFTRRVVPGDVLTVQAWNEGGTWLFRVVNASGIAVIDDGTLTLHT